MAGGRMKPWYKSKTIIFNAVVAALAALEGVTGLLAPYTGPNFYAALCVVLPIGNAVLRVISNTTLTK